MKIILNGQSKTLPAEANLENVISQFCKDKTPVIAELNGEIIKNSTWISTPLSDGDRIELVSFVGGGQSDNKYEIQDTPFVIASKIFTSRFMLGTGKFKNKSDVTDCIAASGTEIVTVALRRIDLERHRDNILEYIPKHVTLLTNTSGARNATEAVRIARLARESGCGNWIKIEVINDSKYLLPDNNETIEATRILSKEGFIVLPYMFPDLYAARALVQAGAAAVMPLGSLIGSNRGLKAREFLKILIAEIREVPVIVDAGIGTPAQAAESMALGMDAVLVNTAVATSENPVASAQAFSLAVRSGRMAYVSRLPAQHRSSHASSPLTGFLYNS